MRVNEILEGGSEEDLPIIYDIIRKKLAAGEKIWLGYVNRDYDYEVLGLRAIAVKDWSFNEDTMCILTYIGHDRTDKSLTGKEEATHNVSDLDDWKLIKKRRQWVLMT